MTQLAGKKDNFNNLDGPEPSSPGPGFLIWLQHWSEDGEWLLFDSYDPNHNDKVFGHTFYHQWNTICQRVIAAKLCFKVRAVTHAPYNDRIALFENGVKVWEGHFVDFKAFLNNDPGSPPWAIGDTLEICIDLANTHASFLPASIPPWPNNVLSALYDNDLDVAMIDCDSEMDYLELIVTVCDTCLYYKAGWDDYCPNGVPDFSQIQDFTRPPDAVVDDGYDGPAALANCLWWFDSKYEPNPQTPPQISDGYQLVYDIENQSIDDHDAANVQPLVAELALPAYLNTGTNGTNINDFKSGINAWLTARSLQNDYYVALYSCDQFDWNYLLYEVDRSQDVILLLGFYLIPDINPTECCRIGGHYVTVAGISQSQLAISDPYFDKSNPGPLQHNDAYNVSHDVYVMVGPVGCESSVSCDMMLGDYPPEDIDAWDFYDENGGSNCVSFGEPGLILNVIEYAAVICPMDLEDTCNYYKQPYSDYAPHGMPDFDQKQQLWIGGTGTWSFDGPVALANCLWWFDSKYEQNTTPPPVIIDTYPLVTPYYPYCDDHDPDNVVPFVSDLATFTNCSNSTNGTNPIDLWNGAINYVQSRGLSQAYTIDTLYVPSLEKIKTEVLRSQDVILLLGFYETMPNGNCNRLGGHYVTAAGTCVDDFLLCISDPWFDMHEGEPPVGIHSSTLHNDAEFVSGPHGTIHHDSYHVAVADPPICNYPIPQIIAAYELIDYPDAWQNVSNFYDLNYMDDGQGGPITPVQAYQGGTIHTFIDFAIVICPTPIYDCGDANGDGNVNVGDAVHLINFVFKGGPAPEPICVGDANGDGGTNVGDAVYLIAFIFSGGPPPVEDCCQ